MSRIGTQPVPVPSGVTVESSGRHVSVKGPRGSIGIDIRPEIDVEVTDGEVLVQTNESGDPRKTRAYHGLTRALIGNMVHGVHEGFSKTLELIGVGWNMSVQGRSVVLNVGFCHPVKLDLPDGVEAEATKPTILVVSGVDKQAVGQFAAIVRAVRPPEPYKGKGIRYENEYVRRKAGKSFGS